MNDKITNRLARKDYTISDVLESGIVLFGEEVKAVRLKHVNLKGSYAKILIGKSKNPELYLIGAHFKVTEHDPYRIRKLLAHKKEIRSLVGQLNEKGLALVPLSMYIKRGKIKVELGLGQGKKKWDHREILKKRALEREVRREVK